MGNPPREVWRKGTPMTDLLTNLSAFLQAFAEADLDEGAADAVTVGMVFQQQAERVWLPRIATSSEPVAYLYEKKGYQSVKFVRELWLTLPDRGWAETPLYSLAPAQAIEARRAETGTGSVHESAVPAGDAS